MTAERETDARPVADVLAEHRICNASYGEVTCYCNPLPWMTLDEYGEHIESLAASEQARTDAARVEVKVAVEEWFTDVSLDDLFDVKGWSRFDRDANLDGTP